MTIVFTVNRGRVYRVAPGGVEVTGNQSIPIESLRPLLRLEQGDLYVASRLSAIEGALTQWYQARFGTGKRARRIGIVALARKLVIALWRFVTTGVVPIGAVLKAA